MEHKGNKTEKTIHAEIAFMAAMKAMGLGVLYEYGYVGGTIDFLVGFPGDKKGSVQFFGSTGVELKTSLNNMLSGTGINFWACPFNYLLVTEDIAYSATKWIEKNEELKHVGILVIMDDYTIELYKQAQFNQETVKYAGKLHLAINEYKPTKYLDCIAFAFATEGNEFDTITVHNFAENKTGRIRICTEITEENIVADEESEVKP